jgi:hypothetical protein
MASQVEARWSREVKSPPGGGSRASLRDFQPTKEY